MDYLELPLGVEQQVFGCRPEALQASHHLADILSDLPHQGLHLAAQLLNLLLKILVLWYLLILFDLLLEQTHISNCIEMFAGPTDDIVFVSEGLHFALVLAVQLIHLLCDGLPHLAEQLKNR